MKTCPTCRQTYSNDIEFCPRDGAQLTPQATEAEAQFGAGLSRRFRIVRRLGEGGMGTVFLAEQIGVGNRPVALKVLLRSLLDNPDFLRRFQEEAASTGRIRHPNVVTIYESGQADDGTPYIAMEFLEGESLRQALTRRGPLPVPEVAEILQQAARGLNAAHKLGIIHRDLKPDNIFLTYPDDVGEGSALPPTGRSASPGVSPREPGGLPYGDGSALPPTGRSPSPGVSPREPGGLPYQVKLVDFGIAKLRESATHTQTGMVLGTPAYMSFEQASGMRSDELDARSDVYSLGIVTYEMLTGRVPFQSDTPAGYLRKHLQDAPPPFGSVKPELAALPQVESVVMKALTKDRDQRYSSVFEFAGEFAQAADAGSHLATQPELRWEAAKTKSHGTVTPAPKIIVPAAVGGTVPAKAVPETALPSRRKWLWSRWKGIGIVASIVWILGAGVYTLKVANDADMRSAVVIARACLEKQIGESECEQLKQALLGGNLESERIEAAIVAFVPVLLGWGFIYLTVFLVRWIKRGQWESKSG